MGKPEIAGFAFPAFIGAPFSLASPPQRGRTADIAPKGYTDCENRASRNSPSLAVALN